MPVTTDSIESAIKSREGNEYRIPAVPMEIPSEIPMVLNMRPLSPACVTPRFT